MHLYKLLKQVAKRTFGEVCWPPVSEWVEIYVIFTDNIRILCILQSQKAQNNFKFLLKWAETGVVPRVFMNVIFTSALCYYRFLLFAHHESNEPPRWWLQDEEWYLNHKFVKSVTDNQHVIYCWGKI